jgi:hypothetical protein
MGRHLFHPVIGVLTDRLSFCIWLNCISFLKKWFHPILISELVGEDTDHGAKSQLFVHLLRDVPAENHKLPGHRQCVAVAGNANRRLKLYCDIIHD